MVIKVNNVFEISNITKLGMEGKISFQESFSMRMEKLRPSKKDIENLSKELIHESFSNAIVLIKGSRGMALERVLDFIK